MGRLRGYPFVALLSAVALSPTGARAQTVVAGPTTTVVTGIVGDTIVVPIAVDMTGSGGLALGAYDMQVSWNPNGLILLGASAGPFAPPAVNADGTAGTVDFAGANPSGATGVTVVGNLTLEIASVAQPGSIDVTFQQLTAANTFDDLLPFLTTTSGTVCGGPLFGDLDGDLNVAAADAQSVLMHSVGLAIPDTIPGDVDGNQAVDPRDALIILSSVVGLDVSAFVVGQFLFGACAVGPADSVDVTPGGTTNATIGDVVPLAASVFAGGATVGAGDIQWTTSNPAIGTVDALGNVTGVSVGLTTITAAVAPGLTGTARVRIQDRHNWIVEASVAGTGPELGSNTHPFSTIAQALARAAAGDTITIRAGTYDESSVVDKEVLIRGSGSPVIAPLNGPGFQLTGADPIVVRDLEVKGSFGGVFVDGADVTLESVTFTGIRGPAVAGFGAGTLTVDDVAIDGVADAAIVAENTNTLVVRDGVIRNTDHEAIWTDATDLVVVVGTEIERTNTEARESYGIEIWHADSARVDSIDAHDNFGGAVLVAESRRFAAYGNDITTSFQPSGLIAASSSSLGVPAGMMVDDVRGTVLRRNAIDETNASGIEIVRANGDTAVVDSNTIQTTNTKGGSPGALSGLSTVMVYGFEHGAGVGQDSTPGHVRIRGNDLTGTNRAVTHSSDNTIQVTFVKGTVVAEGNTITQGGRLAIVLQLSDSTLALDNTVSSTGAVAIGIASLGHVYGAIEGSAFDCTNTAFPSFGMVAGYANAKLTNNTITNCPRGGWIWDLARTASDTVFQRIVVRDNMIDGSGVAGADGISLVPNVQATGSTEDVEIVNNTITGTDLAAIDLGPGPHDAVRVDSNTIRATAGVGIFSVTPTFMANAIGVFGNDIDNANGLSTEGIVLNVTGRAVVRGNRTVQNVLRGITVSRATDQADLHIDSNTVTDNGVHGIQVGPLVGGGWDSLLITRNTVTGNVVDGVVATFDGAGTFVIDTNLIADNGGNGINLSMPASGSLNGVRRNGNAGLQDGGGSVFQFNDFEGNGTGVLNIGVIAVDASNSWWGDPLGPQCVVGCDPMSAGDAVTGTVTFAGFATGPVVGVPAGGPPPVATPTVALQPARRSTDLATAKTQAGLIDPATAVAPPHGDPWRIRVRASGAQPTIPSEIRRP